MSLFRQKKNTAPPQTPWEAYQAKQARQQKHAPAKPERPAEQLPQVTALRQRQRRRNVALVLLPLVVLLVVFGYMVSPLAKVGNISVTGESAVPAQKIINASQLDSDHTVIGLLAGKQRVSARITAKLPEISKVNISVKNLNQVTLSVHEYAVMGYALKGDQYHVVLTSGKVLAASTTTPLTTYPIFSGFKDSEILTIAKVVYHFPTAVRRAVSEVRATRGAANPYQITLTMTDGNTIVADSRTIAKRIKYYPAMKAQAKRTGTFDLEVGAFFTPYNNSTAKK